MRYPKVFFVTPSYPGRYFGGVRPPVGISYVEEFIAANGVRTDAADMNIGCRMKELFAKIGEFQPGLIGLTMMTYQYLNTYKLIDEMKHRFPQIKFIIGGPHVSALEGEVLKQCASVDYAIAGEGERSTRVLCLGVPLHEI